MTELKDRIASDTSKLEYIQREIKSLEKEAINLQIAIGKNTTELRSKCKHDNISKLANTYKDDKHTYTHKYMYSIVCTDCETLLRFRTVGKYE